MSLTDKITSAVRTYVSSFAKGDLDAVMSVYADDCWIEDPVGTERRVGREAVRAFYQTGIDMGVALELEGEIRVAGNEAAFAFRLEAKLPNGTMSVRPIDVMVFDDEGKVTSMRSFYGPTNQGLET